MLIWCLSVRCQRYSVATGWTFLSSSSSLSRRCITGLSNSANSQLFSSSLPSSLRSTSTSTSSSSSSSEVFEELKALALQIQHHDRLYYEGSNPTLTDDEYDALCIQEAKLCVEHPDVWKELLDAGITTRYNHRVGSAADAAIATTITTTTTTTHDDDNTDTTTITTIDTTTTTATSSRAKVSHMAPMLSLDNVHTQEELTKWIQRCYKTLNLTTTTEIDGEIRHHYPPLQILTEPKLDGLSLSLRYQSNNNNDDDNIDVNKARQLRLVQAATRGDGKQGQDVTMAVQDIQSVPKFIEMGEGGGAFSNTKLEIRGEIVLPKSVFGRIQEQQQQQPKEEEEEEVDRDREQDAPEIVIPFSNARNAASGILLRKASNETLRQELQFYAYDAVGLLKEEEDVDLKEKLTELGFQIPKPSLSSSVIMNHVCDGSDGDDKVEIDGLEPLLSYHQALHNHKVKSRDSGGNQDSTPYQFSDYDMDGAVHKIVSPTYRRALGASNRAPRWAVAHKFPTQTVLTKLESIQVQIGRTGALTPVASLEPVDIQGVTVQRATLHNFKHLQQMMGNVKQVPKGTSVLVRRAGEVIPQVVQRVTIGEGEGEGEGVVDDSVEMISLEAPLNCPACNSPTVWEDSKNTSNNSGSSKTTGQVLRCSGAPLSCPPQALASLVHAYSRDALDITGLSEARIQQLMDEQILRIPSDVFSLNATQIEELPGWGKKSVQNLQQKVRQIRDDGISMDRFIYSLGIRFAGKHTANLVASVYQEDVQAFLKDLREAPTSLNEADSFSILQMESDETKGIGPVLVASLQSFAKEEQSVAAAMALAEAVPVLKPEIVKESDEESVGDDDDSNNKPWRGWSVVFTGSLPGMSRSEAQSLARSLMGAKSTPGSVNKSTNLVIVGAKGGKKADQALSLGVLTMDGEDFVKIVEAMRNEPDTN